MIDTPAIEKLLGELEALHEKATPGPWDVWLEHITCPEDAINELVCQVENTDPIASALVLLNAGGKCPAITGCGPTSEANGELIAATVSALPTLITTIRALMEAVEIKVSDDHLNGWQPIETAPKNGTEIDVWCTSAGGYRIPSVSWEDRYNAFWNTEGGILGGDISHWRPLPQPPAIRSKGDA